MKGGALGMLMTVLMILVYAMSALRLIPGVTMFDPAFSRADISGSIVIRRNFRDNGGESHSLKYEILSNDYALSIEEFGYDPQDLSQRVAADLEAKARNFMSKNGVDFKIRFKPGADGNTDWDFYEDRFLDEREVNLARELMNSLPGWNYRLCWDYYRSHGFNIVSDPLEGRVVMPWYPWISRQASPRLGHLIENIRTNDSDVWSRLDTVLSFCQTIPYKIPPVLEDQTWRKRFTGGVHTPLEVDAENWGDCDSKAALFASIWNVLYPHSLVLVSLPGHMLLGVRLPPRFGGDETIHWKSETFLLLEPVGPGRCAAGTVGEYSLDHIRNGRFSVMEADEI